MKKQMILFTCLLGSLGVWGQVRPAPIFTDHMVMRQKAINLVWGGASSNLQIEVVASWSPTDTLRTRSNPSGRWSVQLPTPAADGKSHTLKINDIVFRDVVLGEVWLASGQSNMEWSARHGIENGDSVVAAATHNGIRFFQVPLRGASTPQLRLDAQWVTSTPETMRTVSAVGYFFARKLNQVLKVPVGIISSAWGGTPAEPWIPTEVVMANPRLNDGRIREYGAWRPSDPGECFNQMIYPIAGAGINGVIWYQGESNRPNAPHYNELMTALIGSWRVAFSNPRMPFYFVQIAPYNYGKKDLQAAVVRQQQELTWKTVPYTGMVSIMDRVHDIKNIHPIDKLTVGDRLSAFALNEVYGVSVPNYKSPTFAGASFDKGRATVRLHDAQAGVKVRNNAQEIVGFTLAGIEGLFVPANAKINKDGSIEVWAKEVAHPTAVRYCFDDTTVGNLTNVVGLPVAPFRSDSNN